MSVQMHKLSAAQYTRNRYEEQWAQDWTMECVDRILKMSFLVGLRRSPMYSQGKRFSVPPTCLIDRLNNCVNYMCSKVFACVIAF